jgi:hypothetical protein
MHVAPRGLGTLTIAVTLFATTAARAQTVEPARSGGTPATTVSEPAKPAETTQTETHFYGYQTLIADVASLAALGVGLSYNTTASDLVSASGTIGYAIATPVIHGVHHNPGRTVLSLGMRLGAGLLAGAYYKLSTPGSFSMDGDANAYKDAHGDIGAALLMLSIPALIDAALATETIVTPKERAKPAVTFAPTIDVKTASVGLRLVGTM